MDISQLFLLAEIAVFACCGSYFRYDVRLVYVFDVPVIAWMWGGKNVIYDISALALKIGSNVGPLRCTLYYETTGGFVVVSFCIFR